MKTEDQYKDALARIYELMQLELTQDSPLSDELDVLALSVEDYERKRYPISPPSPTKAIAFRPSAAGQGKERVGQDPGHPGPAVGDPGR